MTKTRRDKITVRKSIFSETGVRGWSVFIGNRKQMIGQREANWWPTREEAFKWKKIDKI